MPGDAALPADVSRETSARLEHYAALLRKWNGALNLVGRGTLADAQVRHFHDSAQLFAHLPEGARHWADLGSGGGFPGLVIAVLAAECAPHLEVTLVESDMRKAAFLRTAARELGLAPHVCAERIETLAPLEADVVSARALAPLPRLLGLVERHLAPRGVAILPKGADAKAELAEALASRSFQVQTYPSATAADASILIVEGLARA